MRVRLSTTVDPELLEQARALNHGDTDASLVEAALRAFLDAHRRASVDEAYDAAYREHPVGQADEWGDLASFGKAVRGR